MGKIDVCTKEYMSNPERFADAFNYYFFKGKHIVKPEELTVQDTTEIIRLFDKKTSVVSAQKFRDVLKMWTVMSDETATYMLLGIENQSGIHYAMPVRNMVYDAYNYFSQVETIGKKHRKEKDVRGDEFLSGFSKTDKIKPILTLVIYWGTKEWDAPRSLFEMFEIKEEVEEILKEYVNDYKIHVIVPREIENFEQFSTGLGNCLRYIWASENPKTMGKLLWEYADIYSNLDIDSVNLIQEVTGTEIPRMRVEEGGVDMCKAIEGMMEEAVKKSSGESARNLFENGVSFDIVKESLTALTEEEIVAIYEEVCNAK